MNSDMIEKSLDIDYNLDYLVIVPSRNNTMVEAFGFTFGNTILFNNTVEDVEFFVQFLKKNLVGQLIFVDYYGEYDEIINTLVDEHEIKFIFTGRLGELSDVCKLNEFNQICNKYDCGVIDEIGFLDYGLFKSVHNKRRNTKFIELDLAKESKKKELKSNNTIGLLNDANSNYASFYNELSSMVFLSEFKAKMLDETGIALRFANDFNIKAEIAMNYEELVCDNVCNLDINFAGTQVVDFIRSMDLGIPCIIGNNDFLNDGYLVLNQYLVVESDDDINEIVEKVKNVVENQEKIMKEYKKFRADYSKEAKKLVKEFLGFEKEERKNKEYEKLLTVVVPVYNTGEYLVGCLDSVIGAEIPGMEILIINDGSTDNSEEIIKEYVKKYPVLIRYIKQKNRGLGNVRNVGLREARGKYIASVDSDDTIQPEMFKKALTYMRKGIDVVMCDWMSVGENENFETAALDWVFEKRKELEGLLYTTIMPSSCNKIIKKNLFVDNGIEYLEQKYEDLSANPRALLRARTVKYIHRPYYNYYLRENSLMRSKVQPSQMVDALKYLDGRLKLKNSAIDEEEFKYYTYSWRIEEYIINPLYEMRGKKLDEVVEYIYNNAFKIMKEIFESRYYDEMLKKLKTKETREFIKERNEAFIKKKLGKFIAETKEPERLNAGIIYYGD